MQNFVESTIGKAASQAHALVHDWSFKTHVQVSPQSDSHIQTKSLSSSGAAGGCVIMTGFNIPVSSSMK